MVVAAGWTGLRPWPLLGSQSVQAARRLGGEAASRLVNALVRRLAREPAPGPQALGAEDLLPSWWLEALGDRVNDAGPASARALLSHPPLTLRWMGPADQFDTWRRELIGLGLAVDTLALPTPTLRGCRAVQVSPPSPVEALPGFADGWFRIQDAGAQRLTDLLALPRNAAILDACAAPGGKSLLMAEEPVEVWAADVSASRLRRLSNDFQRVRRHLAGTLRWGVADLSSGSLPEGFPPLYDLVVLDAPCTASGVIGRHPEIVWRRSSTQLAQAVGLQRQLLSALWPRVRPGGMLLLVVCSVFPDEGEAVHRWFLSHQADAESVGPGLALLPQPVEPGGDSAQDGFTYALFRKTAAISPA